MHILSLSFIVILSSLLTAQSSLSFASSTPESSSIRIFKITRREAASEPKRTSGIPGGGHKPVPLPAISLERGVPSNHNSVPVKPFVPGDLSAYAEQQRKRHKQYLNERRAAPVDPKEKQRKRAADKAARESKRQAASLLKETEPDNSKKTDRAIKMARRKEERKNFREQQDALVRQRMNEPALSVRPSNPSKRQEKSNTAAQVSIDQAQQGGAIRTSPRPSQETLSKSDSAGFRSLWNTWNSESDEISSRQYEGQQNRRFFPESSTGGSHFGNMPMNTQPYQRPPEYGSLPHPAFSIGHQSPGEPSIGAPTSPGKDTASMTQMFQKFRNSP